MIQYLEVLQEILDKGTWKEPARENMPRTISRFSIEKRFNLQDGFPLLTTKKMPWKKILHEMLWFLKGDTNIKYLVDNDVNIWNQDAYGYYLKLHKEKTTFDGSLSMDSFIMKIKEGKLQETSLALYDYKLGDLGPVYGKQWRKWEGIKINLSSENFGFDIIRIDQIQKLINGINENPNSRYHVVTAWNPAEVFETALPSCHMMFHFNCRPYHDKTSTKKPYILDCKMVQRSCDTFLGVPFNIASYAFLMHIVARLTNMHVGDFIWSGNDVHIYEDHIPQVKEQLSRTPTKLPFLTINSTNWKTIDDIKFEDFNILTYMPQEAIKGDLSTGLKK